MVSAARAADVDSAPLYGPIKPMKAGDVLYVFDKGGRGNSRHAITIQTLQGVLARLEGPRIWINAGDKTFVDYFTKTFNVKFDEQFDDDWAGLIASSWRRTFRCWPMSEATARSRDVMAVMVVTVGAVSIMDFRNCGST